MTAAVFDRFGILAITTLVPAIIALVGLGVSPAVSSTWDGEITFILQSMIGLPLLLVAGEFATRRRVDIWIRRLLPVATVVAGVAGLLLGVVLGELPGESNAVAIVLVLTIFIALAVSHVVAIVCIVLACSRRGRIGRVLTIASLAFGAFAVVALMLTTMEPITRPAVSITEDAGRMLGATIFPAAWALIGLAVLDALRRMPEFGGGIERPAVRFTCPRCGCDQVQDDAEGCARCGFDLRIEIA